MFNTEESSPPKMTPEEHFLSLSSDIRRTMNTLAREIWRKFTELDVIVWIEYVNTKVNLADDPSRGVEPITPGTRVGRFTDREQLLWQAARPVYAS